MEAIIPFTSLQSVVITALCAIVPALIYFIYKFSISEKSFEEVLAEQKQRSIEEELKQKSEKGKKDKKFKKSWDKKKKEKPDIEVFPQNPTKVEKVIPIIEIEEPKEKKNPKQKSKKDNSIISGTSTQKSDKSSVEKSQLNGVEKNKTSEPSSTEKLKKSEISIIDKQKKAENSQVEKISKSEICINSDKLVQEKGKSGVDEKYSKQEVTKVKETINKKNNTNEITSKKVESKNESKNYNKKKKEQNNDESAITSTELLSLIKDAELDVDDIQNLIDILLNKQKDSSSWTKLQKELIKRNPSEDEVKVNQKVLHKEIESDSLLLKSEIDNLKKSKEDLQKVHFLLVKEHTNLVSSHNSELKNLKTRMSSVSQELVEAKAQNEHLLKEIQCLKSVQPSLEHNFKTLQDELKAKQKHCSGLEVKIKELSSKESNQGHLIHQNGVLPEQIQDTSSVKLLEEKEKLLTEQGALIIKKDGMLNQIRSELDGLKLKIKTLEEEAGDQVKKNNELREKNWKAMDALKLAETNAEQKIAKSCSEAEEKLHQLQLHYEEKLHSTKSNSSVEDKLREIEIQSEKRLNEYNSEVDKNKKMSSEIEKINAQYKSADFTIGIMEKKIEDLNIQMKDNDSRTRECLQRLYPSVSVDNSLPQHHWVEEFEKLADLSVKTSLSKSFDTELTQLTKEYEMQLLEKQKHIEKILSDTENTLKELQHNAESREKHWQEKLNAIESEFKDVISEKEAWLIERQTMHLSLQKLSELDELKEKILLLQNTLETSENGRLQLEQKHDEVHKNCLNLKDRLESKEIEITELKKNNEIAPLKKEIENITSKLELEKKISKDFSSQMIRLNSLVKIGQDSLCAEQEVVKKLKKELDALQASTTNGKTQNSFPHESTPAKNKSSEKAKKNLDVSAKK